MADRQKQIGIGTVYERMELKQAALQAAESVGIDQPLLSLYDAVTGFSDVPVDESVSSHAQSAETPGSRVIFVLIPGYESLCYRLCTLGHAFRAHGHEPIILRDDGTLPADLGRTVGSGGMIQPVGRYRSNEIPKQFGIETVEISDLIDTVRAEGTPTSVADNGHLGDEGLDRYALASLKKRLKVYDVELEDSETKRRHDQFKRSAVALFSATQALIDEVDPIAVFVNESAYVQGGAPLEAARRESVPVYTQMFGYQDETILTSSGGRSPLPPFAPRGWVDRQMNRQLSPEERDEIDRLMEGRASGENVSVQYTSATDQSIQSGNEITVGVFTNLLWDASLTPEAGVYQDVYDWLGDTIDTLRDHNEVSVILKTHPAEAEFGTRESVTDWIEETYETIPDNISLLRPDTEVNTYRVIDDIDVGIVYNSTVGLEMAYEGVPVVVAGETHYRDLGFTIDPPDVISYQRCIDTPAEINPPTDQRDLAARYAHLLFVRRHVPFPYISRSDGKEFNLRPVTHEDLAPGTEPWDTFVDAVVSSREIVRPEYAEWAQSK